MSGVTTTPSIAVSSQTIPANHDTQPTTFDKTYTVAAARQQALPAPTSGAQSGPVQTTLALGEEDGGAASGGTYATYDNSGGVGSVSGPASSGHTASQVTTLAIGEEDGGIQAPGTRVPGTMAPIYDDHAIIGHQSTESYGRANGPNGTPEGYGTMQPIYSPGEPEYPAFAKTSQTVDLLNFHPVARVERMSVPVTSSPAPVALQSTPVASAPLYSSPVSSSPAYAAPAPIGTIQPQAVSPANVTGNYQAVGSYDDYLAAQSGSLTAAPAPVSAEPVYEAATFDFGTIPSAETAQPTYQAAPVEPTYQPAPAYEAVPIEPVYQPAAPAEPVYESVTIEQAAPVETYTAPAQPAASAEIFEKDTPFDYTGPVDDVDPADGNPNYGAPSEAAQTAKPDVAPVAEPVAKPDLISKPDAAKPEAAASIDAMAKTDEAAKATPAAKPEATYIEVSLDDYLVDDTSATTAPAASSSAPDAGQADTAPAPSLPSPPPAPPLENGGSISSGGSYVVIDQAPAAEGADTAVPPANTSEPSAAEPAADVKADPKIGVTDDLRITTLAVGEEDGS